ncbi:glycosyl hydrolase family 18 protein [Edaphobacter aggregans]|uniref:glycosyl hydrolase family 18 protein n=1 Tax=Edaphobacter aggregans TaxID=570835 RepID=UPI000691FFCE|nr:glycosyl hydrolase family 18 protein [Edaphobacter aggregans]
MSNLPCRTNAFVLPLVVLAVLLACGTPRARAQTACYPAWSATAIYVGGNTASSNGVNYTANWWTQGQNPATNNGGSGSGEPWTSNGTCSGSSGSTGTGSSGGTSTGSAYGGTPWPIPGTIQAENFDTGGENVGYHTDNNTNQGGQYRTGEGVSIEATTDTGGGYDVGWVTADEWLNYTMKVASSGSYLVQVRVANNGQGGTFHVGVDGATATSELTVPNTGGWQNWTTLSTTITLSAGQHIVQLHMDSVGSAGTVGNFNWFSISSNTTASTRLVGYLPNYNGSYANYATTLSFSKMTHLNLAFGNPPRCNGTCTASSNMTFSLGQSDADIAAVVNAAHAAGVKVVLSIGGGGGDQQILQFYNAGLSTQLVDSLANYLAAHNLDGVDVDIEDPNNMGNPYATFVNALVTKLRPQGKIISAAVAQYLQASMPDLALHQFDFVNVMVYSNYSDAQNALQYYSVQKSVPKSQITLGVPFFGQSGDGNIEEEYNTILAAYPNAWQLDMVNGGSLDNGITLYYVGEDVMAEETQLGKQYGGIMIWELTGDAPAPHSLLNVIKSNL